MSNLVNKMMITLPSSLKLTQIRCSKQSKRCLKIVNAHANRSNASTRDLNTNNHNNAGGDGGGGGAANNTGPPSLPFSDAELNAFESFTTVAGTVDIVEPEEAEVDIFGELNTGNFHFIEDLEDEEEEELLRGGSWNTLGLSHPEEGLGPQQIMELSADELADRVGRVLRRVGVPPSPYPAGEPQRAIYCSRTLNMRAIQAIGYDLDYTLVHYSVGKFRNS